jgi:photosystem II stability/assembly factor-like uncharacterized protein
MISNHSSRVSKPITTLFSKTTLLRRLPTVSFAPLAIVCLTGCEAKLDLSGVEKTLDQSIRRTDQLMVIERVGDELLVLGNNGLLLKRATNETDWQRSQLGEAGQHPNFISGSVCGDGSLVALSYQAEVWHTADAGESWTVGELPTEEDVQAIDCTVDNQMWVVGSYSTILNSGDGGDSWQEQTLDEDSMLTAITFSSESRGYAAGEFGLLAVTDDGGDSWQVIDPVGDELYPLAVRFDAQGQGWVGGLQGVIMHSEDDGASWVRTQTPTDSPIYNFIAVGDQLLATGDQGVVLHWFEGGWIIVETPDIPTYYRAGVALNESDVLIAGGWGVLLPLSIKPAAAQTN